MPTFLIFDLSISERIDFVIPSDPSTDPEKATFEKYVNISEGLRRSAITFQHPTGVKRLDLNIEAMDEGCPNEWRCVKDMARLLYVDSSFDIFQYESDIFEFIESEGYVEINNGCSNLVSGRIIFCKIWCIDGEPLNIDGQIDLPCLPRLRKGVLEDETSLKGS